MPKDMEIDLPENRGLSSKSLLEFFSRLEQLNLDVNSFILLQNGKVVKLRQNFIAAHTVEKLLNSCFRLVKASLPLQ